MRFALSILPLVLFYAGESVAGLRAGILAGLAGSALHLGWTRWADGRWSRMAVWMGGLVAALGGLSLLSDDPRFVLWGPVVGDLVFALLLVAGQLGGRSVLRDAMEEQDPELDLHPIQARWLDGMAWRLAGMLVVHAAWTAWSVGAPRETWLFVSGPGAWILMGAQGVGEFLWASRVVNPAVDAAEAEDDRAAPPG